MLRQTQSQGLRQQQKTDPQLLLTNRLLQMTSMELRQYLSQEIAENPALESAEDTAESSFDYLNGAASPLGGPLLERGRRQDTFLSPPAGPDPEPDPLQFAAASQTLQDHLLEQLHALAGQADLRIARYLVHSIDDDGYLRCDTEEAAAELDVTVLQVEAAVRLIQSLDPCGVGARSLQECLLIQARAHAAEGSAPPHLEVILTRYWKDLAASRLKEIARSLRIAPAVAESTVEWLRANLSPYPGNLYRPSWAVNRDQPGQAVRPDVEVRVDETGRFIVELARGDAPELHVSPHYARLWKEVRERPEQFTPAERKHVREYLHRAQMFLKSLQDRGTILQRVAECLVEEQERYFRTEREEDMMPLTRSQLSTFLRVHESTVSRAVKDKYLQLPSGRVVPLSYFFDRALCHRKLVANVVAAENPSSPYSDQEIADILRRQGVLIARRTVMKYREEMNILSSRRRARAA